MAEDYVEDYVEVSREELARADAIGDNDAMLADAVDFGDWDDLDDAARVDPQLAREVFGLCYVRGDSEMIV